MKKELTPNYGIMFKSAVSMLQTTYSELNKVQRKIFEFEHRGWFNQDGYYIVTFTEEGYREELAKKEQHLAEQLRYCIEEVNRLRKLKDEEKEKWNLKQQ